MPDEPAGSSKGAAGDRAERTRGRGKTVASAPASSPTSTRHPASTTRDVETLIRRQESLLAFIEAMTSEAELQPLLTRILRYACELIGADNGAIGLVDPGRDVVRMEAIYSMPASELGTEIPRGVGLTGAVVARGEPVVLGRYGDVAAPTQPELLENAVMGVPITGTGGLIGVFGVGRAAEWRGDRLIRPVPFDAAEVSTLSLFARHAGVAIENAQRSTQERAKRKRLEAIARIGRIITSDRALAEQLGAAAETIFELLEYRNVLVALVDPADPTSLPVRAAAGASDRIVKGEYRIPLDRGIMGEVVRTRRLQSAVGVGGDPAAAELAVPILLGDRVLGVLHVHGGGRFGEEDAASLGVIADQLAVAVENERLQEAGQRVTVLEARERLARDLHDSVAQHLFGMMLMGESLSRAWGRDKLEGRRRMDRLVELSRAALCDMHALLAKLRPEADSPPDRPDACGGTQAHDEPLS